MLYTELWVARVAAVVVGGVYRGMLPKKKIVLQLDIL